MEEINYDKMIAEAKRLKQLNEIVLNEIIEKFDSFERSMGKFERPISKFNRRKESN